MSSIVGKRYQQPRRVPEESVFTDKRTKRKQADKYTGMHGKANNPNEYTGRDVAKEQMTRQFKKELRGKLYYGQEKV